MNNVNNAFNLLWEQCGKRFIAETGGTVLHFILRPRLWVDDSDVTSTVKLLDTILATKRIDVNSVDKDGNTALHLIFYHGVYSDNLYESARKLIHAGANVNKYNKNKRTALHLACLDSTFDNFVILLLQNKARVDAKDMYQKTPLHYIVERSPVMTAQLIDTYGANVNAVDKYRRTPLYYAQSRDVAKVLIQRKASLAVRDISGYSPMAYWVSRQYPMSLYDIDEIIKPADPVETLFSESHARKIANTLLPLGNGYDAKLYLELKKNERQPRYFGTTAACNIDKALLDVLYHIYGRERQWEKPQVSEMRTMLEQFLIVTFKKDPKKDPSFPSRYPRWQEGRKTLALLAKCADTVRIRPSVLKEMERVTIEEQVNTLANGLLNTYNKFLARFSKPLQPPRKKNRIINGLKKWTKENVYKKVQNKLRTGSQGGVNNTIRNLVLYMEKYALRAPQRPHGWNYLPQNTSRQPPGVRNSQWKGPRTYLYRGVHGVQANTARKYGSVLSKGYVAMSRYLDTSKIFGKFPPTENNDGRSNNTSNGYTDSGDGVLFRVSMNNIPRGTPWVWFSAKNVHGTTKDLRKSPWRLKKKPLSQINEGEVLLPPGSIFVFPSSWTRETIQTTIDAAKTIERTERPLAPGIVDKVPLRKESRVSIASFGNILASVSIRPGVLEARFKLKGRGGPWNIKLDVKQATLDVLAILEKVRRTWKNGRFVIDVPARTSTEMYQIYMILGHLIQSRGGMFGNLTFSRDIGKPSFTKSIYVPLKMPVSPAKRSNSNWNVPFSVLNNNATQKIRALKSVRRSKRLMTTNPIAAKKRKSTTPF